MGEPKERRGGGKRFGLLGKGRKKDVGDILDNPRVILFVIGGLSHQEIVSLHQIEEQGLVNCQIIAGGSNICDANSLLEVIKDLDRFTLSSNPKTVKRNFSVVTEDQDLVQHN